MSWHLVGTRRYFYVHKRIGGKPVRRYVGAGQIGEIAGATAELRRLQRAIEARECKAEADRLDQAEEPLIELCEITEMLTRAALVAAGYHRHDRGKWRYRRGNTISA
jgi:hypothetical protein